MSVAKSFNDLQREGQQRHGSAIGQGHRNRDDLPDQVLPRSDAAEQSVLGSVVCKADVMEVVRPILEPGDFFDPNGPDATIYRHFVRLHDSGKPIDTTTIVESLRSSGDLERIGGHAYIAELAKLVPDSGTAEYYARLAKAASIKRQAHRLLSERASDACNGTSPEDLLARILADVEVLSGKIASPTDRYRVVTSTVLATTTYKHEELVENILMKGMSAMLYGPEKALKTSLAVDLGMAAATGGFFLGKWRVPRPIRTLIMSGESGMTNLQETAFRVAAAANRRLEDIDGLDWTDDLPSMDSPRDLAALTQLIKRGKYELCIVDPVYQMCDGEGTENLFKMGRRLAAIARACHDAGATPILVHHTNGRSPIGDQPLTLTDLAFAGFKQFAAQWLAINRREEYVPGSGHHKLVLAVGGRPGHGGCWHVTVDEGHRNDPGGRTWHVDVQTATASREERKLVQETEAKRKKAEAMDALENRIMEAFYEVPGHRETRSAIYDEVKGNKPNFKEACDRLVRAGIIRPCKMVKNMREEDALEVVE